MKNIKYLVLIISFIFLANANAGNVLNPLSNSNLVYLTQSKSNSTVNKNDNYALNSFAKNYVLYFFYDSSCPNCRAFAPILKKFALQYNIKVIPYTFGYSLPEFPNSLDADSIADKFNIQYTPTLFAINKKTHKAFFISDSLVDDAYLHEKILTISSK